MYVRALQAGDDATMHALACPRKGAVYAAIPPHPTRLRVVYIVRRNGVWEVHLRAGDRSDSVAFALSVDRRDGRFEVCP